MKYAQKVKKRYLTILNDMAKNRDSYVKNPEKDFTRKRKLSFQDTINTIVTYDAGSIGRCIKRYIPKVEKTPNDVEGHILMEMTPIRDGRSFKRDKSRHQSVFTTFRHN